MGTLEVDKSLKAAFKETLEPHGFKKVKGRYPHFVRMATPEIIQVINYRLEQALSPQLEEKRFEVYCAVGSIYRPEINLNRSVYASMDWINTTQLDMYFTAKRNGIPVYENEQPRVDYIIKKGDEASLREQIAFAMTGIEHYVIPAFDKVVDLKTCVDYLEIYGLFSRPPAERESTPDSAQAAESSRPSPASLRRSGTRFPAEGHPPSASESGRSHRIPCPR